MVGIMDIVQKKQAQNILDRVGRGQAYQEQEARRRMRAGERPLGRIGQQPTGGPSTLPRGQPVRKSPTALDQATALLQKTFADATGRMPGEAETQVLVKTAIAQFRALKGAGVETYDAMTDAANSAVNQLIETVVAPLRADPESFKQPPIVRDSSGREITRTNLVDEGIATAREQGLAVKAALQNTRDEMQPRIDRAVDAVSSYLTPKERGGTRQDRANRPMLLAGTTNPQITAGPDKGGSVTNQDVFLKRVGEKISLPAEMQRGSELEQQAYDRSLRRNEGGVSLAEIRGQSRPGPQAQRVALGVDEAALTGGVPFRLPSEPVVNAVPSLSRRPDSPLAMEDPNEVGMGSGRLPPDRSQNQSGARLQPLAMEDPDEVGMGSDRLSPLLAMEDPDEVGMTAIDAVPRLSPTTPKAKEPAEEKMDDGLLPYDGSSTPDGEPTDKEKPGMFANFNTDMVRFGLSVAAAASKPGATLLGALSEGGLAAMDAKEKAELIKDSRDFKREILKTQQDHASLESKFDRQQKQGIAEAKLAQTEAQLKDAANRTAEVIRRNGAAETQALADLTARKENWTAQNKHAANVLTAKTALNAAHVKYYEAQATGVASKVDNSKRVLLTAALGAIKQTIPPLTPRELNLRKKDPTAFEKLQKGRVKSAFGAFGLPPSLLKDVLSQQGLIDPDPAGLLPNLPALNP